MSEMKLYDQNPPLIMWTLYEHPTDFPEWFVARRSEITAGEIKMTGLILRADTLDGLRALLPPGLVRLPRSDNDDPVIIETWM